MFKKAPVVAASPTLGVPALPALPALPAATSTESQPKPPDDDGLRTGDLLVMPKDGEYRATHPVLPKVDAGAGTVIVTPPSAAKPRPPGKAEE
ncbi:MAG: hypothetical protein DVB26_01695 [Verrucomicrobia bacterium]|nr:MAG: hypothetical protein DVB26_01695 [Verrucomicrobiota bacterium]